MRCENERANLLIMERGGRRKLSICECERAFSLTAKFREKVKLDLNYN